MHPYFSEREFERRYRRAKEIMAEGNIDALVVSGEENYTYLTGATSLIPWYSYTRPVFLIVPQDGEAVVISSKALERETRQLSYFQRIVTHSTVSGLPGKLIAGIMRKMNLGRGRIGAELGYEQRMGMPYSDFRDLALALPGAEFVDASSVFWKLRMAKSPEEVDLIRRACEITSRARQECLKKVRAGMSESDVGRLFRQYMIEFGADSEAFVMVNSFLPFQTNKPLRSGELLYLDGGAKVGGYCCDYSRLSTLGASSSEQKATHQTLVDINESMQEQLRPGATCAEIFEVYAKGLQKGGYSISTVGRAGHGQGMLVTEPPSISPSDTTVLEPGFVLSTEPSIPSADGIYIIEDVHLIRENGSQPLTEEPTLLREL